MEDEVREYKYNTLRDDKWEIITLRANDDEVAETLMEHIAEKFNVKKYVRVEV